MMRQFGRRWRLEQSGLMKSATWFSGLLFQSVACCSDFPLRSSDILRPLNLPARPQFSPIGSGCNGAKLAACFFFNFCLKF